jgi:hypothetical protein
MVSPLTNYFTATIADPLDLFLSEMKVSGLKISNKDIFRLFFCHFKQLFAFKFLFTLKFVTSLLYFLVKRSSSHNWHRSHNAVVVLAKLEGLTILNIFFGVLNFLDFINTIF